MKQRCFNPNSSGYKNYGARGIVVCEEWRYSFENFIRDMGPRPSIKHSIERLDNSKGYFPDNCVWKEIKYQPRNQRKRKDNTSGICGVIRQTSTRGDKTYVNWQAVWKDLSGKHRSKSFSVRKYGDKFAFNMARQYREDKIKELNTHGAGYAKQHGKGD